MLISDQYDISVVIATCNRYKMLSHCLEQLSNQELGGLRVETIVIDESDNNCPKNKAVINQYRPTVYHKKRKEGYFGVFAKDLGTEMASAPYVCFWDDDNIYNNSAVTSLFNSACGFDIGVVRTKHFRNNGSVSIIPENWDGEFIFSQIDTMCLCVRSALARKHKWSEQLVNSGTEYCWLQRLGRDDPTVNFSDVVIGSHL